MIRRWLIRGLALTLLALCIVAWAGSYGRGAYIRHESDGWQEWAELETGGMGFEWCRVSGPVQFHWLWGTMSIEPDFWMVWGEDDICGWTGFHLMNRENQKSVVIPLWFPTLLSAALGLFVWRKTRPKYNGKGFPVEPTPKAEVK